MPLQSGKPLAVSLNVDGFLNNKHKKRQTKNLSLIILEQSYNEANNNIRTQYATSE